MAARTRQRKGGNGAVERKLFNVDWWSGTTKANLDELSRSPEFEGALAQAGELRDRQQGKQLPRRP